LNSADPAGTFFFFFDRREFTRILCLVLVYIKERSASLSVQTASFQKQKTIEKTRVFALI
jgi:hypothetical protein